MKSKFRDEIGRVQRKGFRCVVEDEGSFDPPVYNGPRSHRVRLTFQSSEHYYVLDGNIPLEDAWRLAAAAPIPSPELHAVRARIRFHKVWLEDDQAELAGQPFIKSWYIIPEYAPDSSNLIQHAPYRVEALATGEPMQFDPQEVEANDPRKPILPDTWWSQDFYDRGIPMPKSMDELRETLFREYIKNKLPGVPWIGPKGTSWYNPGPWNPEDSSDDDYDHSPRFR